MLRIVAVMVVAETIVRASAVVQLLRVRIAMPSQNFLRAISLEYISPAAGVGICRASQHEPPYIQTKVNELMCIP